MKQLFFLEIGDYYSMFSTKIYNGVAIIKLIQIIITLILIIWSIISLIIGFKKDKKNKSKTIKKSINKIIIALAILLLPILFCQLYKLKYAKCNKDDWGKNYCSYPNTKVSQWIQAYNGEGIYGPAPSLKPIIYIYPEEESNIKVTLPYKEHITVSYPKYVDGWDVKAYPDGTLIDNNTGRELYSLYYEADYDIKPNKNEGFIVKGEDSASFLEEKLEILGLNARESEEFIVYWLPKLEENKYNYIYFATNEELDKAMPLEFSKDPDTLIRILMMHKPLDKKINIKEQKLTKTTRSGYSVIEWGGRLIK